MRRPRPAQLAQQSTAQQSAAWHSAAQHCTAWHSRAQHSSTWLAGRHTPGNAPPHLPFQLFAVTDRWGHTPLDEALRVGAGPVIRYFASIGLETTSSMAAQAGTMSILRAAQQAAGGGGGGAVAGPGFGAPLLTVTESMAQRRQAEQEQGQTPPSSNSSNSGGGSGRPRGGSAPNSM